MSTASQGARRDQYSATSSRAWRKTFDLARQGDVQISPAIAAVSTCPFVFIAALILVKEHQQRHEPCGRSIIFLIGHSGIDASAPHPSALAVVACRDLARAVLANRQSVSYMQESA
jgi:hypothetical protein